VVPIAEVSAPVVRRAGGRLTIESATPRERLVVSRGNPGDGHPLFEPAATESLVTEAAHRTLARSGPFAVRTVREFTLAPVRPGDPLIWRYEPVGRAVTARGIGEVEQPDNAFLGELVNTGWVAATGDGGVVFASAIRPEVRRYGVDGRLLWISVRRAPVRLERPSLFVERGTLRARFAEAQHGIAVGPDSRIYVLGVAEHPDSFSVDVIGASGVWLRTARVARGVVLRADRRGRVLAAGAKARAGEQRIFASFDLPSLDRQGHVRLSDFAGRIVVVNFWASWCAPCRAEMPALDRLARALDSERVAIIGLNEDANVDDARRFLRELGGVSYPLAEGGGRLRARYGYRGLPYTLVLDARHWVAAEFYGFGDSIEALESAISAELEGTFGADLRGAAARAHSDASGRGQRLDPR
jgi:thiol-disulfide isomerase/thioredoxin